MFPSHFNNIFLKSFRLLLKVLWDFTIVNEIPWKYFVVFRFCFRYFWKMTAKFQFNWNFKVSNLAMAKVQKVNIAVTYNWLILLKKIIKSTPGADIIKLFLASLSASPNKLENLSLTSLSILVYRLRVPMTNALAYWAPSSGMNKKGFKTSTPVWFSERNSSRRFEIWSIIKLAPQHSP